MKKLIDLTGQKFGRLTVMEFLHRTKKTAFWKCRCDCGNEVRAAMVNLKSGKVRSCGCLFKDIMTTHGRAGSRIYEIWVSMKKRCDNPRAAAYKEYGGRGIKVCRRWMKFENFLKDMGEPPNELSLDRIDNNKGYNKKNCRWATRAEQANNKRNNIWITYNGERKTIANWAKKIGISKNVIYYRFKRGLSIEDIFSTTHLQREGIPINKTIRGK